MPRASTPQSDRVPSASSASSGRAIKRDRESNGKEKGKSTEDIGMYLDRFLEDVSDLPSELQVIHPLSYVFACRMCIDLLAAQVQTHSGT
jgi:hypothetical protein